MNNLILIKDVRCLSMTENTLMKRKYVCTMLAIPVPPTRVAIMGECHPVIQVVRVRVRVTICQRRVIILLMMKFGLNVRSIWVVGQVLVARKVWTLRIPVCQLSLFF
eukprot:TRINITY_DN16466_c0_g1_i1.p1 TRINITY_DN16466_c0_g1~~TRINITY_DN16466_c0_g1_i1.p1  ORF type:complete len:107 (+),score=7.88 TRINITY_DN16466_c0_g1_i1:492-812(+)